MPDPTTPTTPAEPTATATPSEPTTQTQGDPADLGDAGKKALDVERAARKAAEKEAADFKAQIDKINQANESAVEKAQREANEFKEAASRATADALRLRVAVKHSISEEDAELFLTGTDEATLEKQAERLAARAPVTSAGPRPDLTQGGNGGASGAGDPATAFADLITKQRAN